MCYATVMSVGAARTRSEQLRSLPTLSQAAGFIGLDTGGMSRAVRSVGIEPKRWGRRDKHLRAAEILQVARVAQRASLEEVAGAILRWTESNHPEAVAQTTAEIDEFFAALPEPTATPPQEFLVELRAALPERWARRAEEIWRAHASSV
jgi:hypothetical protein